MPAMQSSSRREILTSAVLCKRAGYTGPTVETKSLDFGSFKTRARDPQSRDDWIDELQGRQVNSISQMDPRNYGLFS